MSEPIKEVSDTCIQCGSDIEKNGGYTCPRCTSRVCDQCICICDMEADKEWIEPEDREEKPTKIDEVEYKTNIETGSISVDNLTINEIGELLEQTSLEYWKTSAFNLKKKGELAAKFSRLAKQYNKIFNDDIISTDL